MTTKIEAAATAAQAEAAAVELDTEALDLVVGGVELYCRKTGGNFAPSN